MLFLVCFGVHSPLLYICIICCRFSSIRPPALLSPSSHPLPSQEAQSGSVISIVCLMYADDNGLSTHSPAHASISLHPSVIRPFALTSDRRGEQTIEGEDEVSLNQVLMEKKNSHSWGSNIETSENPLIHSLFFFLWKSIYQRQL